jgi:outer membrane protein assembly factor BamB
VYALNATNGQQVWQYTMDDYPEFSPILAGNFVIAANRAGQLLALDAKTGKLDWQTNLNGTPFSQPEFWAARSAIVLKLGDHEVGAFNVVTGKPLWLYNTPLVVTPPVVNGKTVDVITSDGQVIALR